MFQSIKRLWLVLVFVLVCGQSVFGFSLLGPFNESYQVNTIGYNLVGDIGAPKNIGEGYRWNTRNLYYAYDANFLNFFGSNGVAAVDQAFAVMNNLTNLSSYTPDLREWPLNTVRINFRARALALLDVKSITMGVLMEQLGLAPPDRYVWTLRARVLPAGAQCPAYNYLVIQRSFDPVTQVYSPYVNGVLYDYEILELCLVQPPPLPPIGLAVPFPADPTQTGEAGLAVADFDFSSFGPGSFYTGLSRDDVGGLRYLYGTNRLNVEAVATNSLLVFTNTANPQLLVTSNLNLFLQQALTNNAAALQAIYTNLVITATSNIFSNVVTTNITATLVHPTYAPAGTFVGVLVTNFTTNVTILFSHTFANVVTNQFFTNGFVTITQNTVTAAPFGVPGQVQTNATTTTTLANFVNGDFFIIPSNSLCGSGFQIVSTQLVSVIPVTNNIIIATNSAGATNVNGQSFNQEVITYFTNFTFVVFPVECRSTNTVALREGLDKINFIRQDFDDLKSGIWNPVTNSYTLTIVTNGLPVVQTIQRVVTQPDILISAADLVVLGPPLTVNLFSRTINFNTNQELSALAGPGTIQSPVLFTFNNVGPAFLNTGPFFLNGATAIFPQTASALFFQWGSFDGTTNAPIAYPDGTSLSNLENQLFFQITTGLMPTASITTNTAGNPYHVQLQATGGSPPYIWARAANTAALPPGLTLSSAGVVSGVPTQTGTFDFTVQATDIGARVIQKDLFIEVDP